MSMNMKLLNQIQQDNGLQRSLNPTCTGTSVFAIRYDGGVILAADTNVSYGKTSRYKHFSRVYKISENVAIAFSGDHADFQYLKGLIDNKILEYKAEMNDFTAELSAMAMYSWLSWIMYYRRSKFNPLYNSIVVAGTRGSHTDPEPFLGVMNLRGVAYHPKYLATGFGAMLIQQTMENWYRAAGEKDGKTLLTKESAIELMRSCIELAYYRDTSSAPEFDILTISSTDGGVKEVTNIVPVVGKWKQLAEGVKGYD